jgi:hypothetical protein
MRFASKQMGLSATRPYHYARRFGKRVAKIRERWLQFENHHVRGFGDFFRPDGTSEELGRFHPAMNRWAIVGRPCGTWFLPNEPI